MSQKKTYRFDTRVIHACQRPGDWQGSTLPPIYQAASHLHPTADQLSRTFAGKTDDHIYMRLTNPTNRVLEEKLADLECGRGAVVMASGMAAVSNACMALLRAGDEFVASSSLFMSTYLLFKNVFKKYGISVRQVDATDAAAIDKAITGRTRFVYLETIGNPTMDVPDLKQAAEIAHKHGVPLVVDNTLCSPYLCRPIELGADVVIHSTTKYLSGHGGALGGAVIDGGNFDWSTERFSDFKPFVDRKGHLAFLDRVWREHHINFGTTQAPLHSYLTVIGLDTLAVRMQKHMENAMTVARYLSERPEVSWVNYPGLPGHASHAVARRQFENMGFGGMMAFGLKDQSACFRFIDGLRLIYHLANLGDCKTLVIHPYSSQYVSFDDAERRRLAITPDLIRLSVGIEAAEDICEDIGQALDKSRD
jgi:O-acetylhomoserine (thiol)-lyase